MELLKTKPALRNDELTIRTATEKAEIDHLRHILNEGHYLKAGRPAGHVLWQGIYRNDSESGCPELVAVLCWGGAAKRLKERDKHIGWDAVTCANRLKLVVQLRRFYVVEDARRPNLASQSLALSLRTLGDQFQTHHGFTPLLAESFHDPEKHTGTLYKATNWQPLGLTKGYKRHRRDFYQDLGKPKQLWIRPLKKFAFSLLARPGLLPPVHQAAIAEGDTAGARSALKCSELRTLREALLGLTDTRNPKSLRHPFSAMLTLIVYGLICGANDVKAIWHKCGPLDQNQRRAIGLTKRNKKTGLLIMPGYGAINDIVNRICPVELARHLNAWLIANSEHLPKSLALDGKDLGAKGRLGGIVTLCFHATGQPLAQRAYSGKKDDCELPVAQHLLGKEAATQLPGTLVTGDALNAQKKRHSSSSPTVATTSWA
jgi:imidazoleglycerol phosphate synthase glutamine amidotransferase subunit HisH